MADKDGMKVAKDYHVDEPFARQGGFYVKGMADVDWGMKTRLASIFQPESGHTVMLAFDHGYFMGSTAGLERLDLVIPPVIEHIDVLMGTRGALRTCISPSSGKAVALRVSCGSSVLDEDLSHEVIGVSIEDAVE
jgi:putative autoinducer-2 (AI-2) aldolase